MTPRSIRRLVLSPCVPRLLLSLSVALTTGCVLSTDAVITPATAAFDERLLGSWRNPTSGDRAVVRRDSANGYLIAYTDRSGRSAILEGRLGRLRDRLVLDVRLRPGAAEQADPFAPLVIAGHALVAIELTGDAVHAAAVREDSLRAWLRRGRVRTPHLLEEDRIILTGSGAQVRAFLGDYLRKGGALEDADVWRRADTTEAIAVASPPGRGTVIPSHGGTPLVFCRAPGLSANIKIDSVSTGATRFAAGTAEVAAGDANTGTHAGNDEAIYFLSAGGRAFVGTDTTDVQPGVMLYVPQGVRHGFLSARDRPIRFVWMVAPQALARSFRTSGVAPGSPCPAP